MLLWHKAAAYLFASTVIASFICCLTSCRPTNADQENKRVEDPDSKTALGEAVGPGSTLVRPGDPLLPAGSGTPDDPDALAKTWSQGRFDGLKGVDLVSKVREQLDLKLLTPVEPEMHDKLCLKISQFLEAYSTADFDAYLRFRGSDNLADDDDERVRKRLSAVRKDWSSNLGPEPATGLDLLRAIWNTYVKSESPPIAAVNWTSCRATVAGLPSGELVEEEWSPDGGGQESHLYQMLEASRRAAHSQTIMRTPIPNAGSIKNLLLEDDRLLYADFEIIRRASTKVSSPVIVRFVWNPRTQDWVPWGLLPLLSDINPIIW